MSPFLRYRTFYLAFSKSSLVTFILRSLRAIKPAYVHIALISAPERSSFVAIKSTTFTSSFKLILPV